MAIIPNKLGTLTQNSTLSWLDAVKRAQQRLLADWDIFDIAACMTLVLLMLYSGDYWYLKRPITILCAAAILYRPLRSSEIFWFVTTILLAASNYYNWHLIDNHKYLITYWCLALYLSRLSSNPATTAAISARYLIGLAFLFATISKLISPDYLDGTFFHYSLLTDDRFASVALLLGNLTQFAHLENSQSIKELVSYSSTLGTVQLQSTAQIVLLAIFLTWWTIIIECLIAVAFLLPLGFFLSKWRDLLLLLFVLSTYSVAPVIGFGWVLVIMGLVQSTLTSKYTQFLYLAAFFLLQVYLAPWQSILQYNVPIN